MKRFFLYLVMMALITSCAKPSKPPAIEEALVEEPETKETPLTKEDLPTLLKVPWEDITGWYEDDPSLAFEAFLKSCNALRWRSEWQSACETAKSMKGTAEYQARQFFEQNFVPYRVQQSDGSVEGLLTGYYVPDLKGSRYASSEYPYPLYRRPDDLLVIDLNEVYPDLGDYRLRGRLDGNRVIPYWDRAEIDSEDRPLEGQELFWVADPVELFFLHIQGSGMITLDGGDSVLVNYADQNGHPYRSIGKYLLDRGIMARHEMSMQNIRRWARDNPQEVEALLNQNPSYVFFRELDNGAQTPPGSLGVPLTPGRSLAVDRRYIPLGAPVFVETTWPNSDQPLKRLMMAQDTGGAIKGKIRGDFFWGLGEEAGAFAGRMKQAAKFWVLQPQDLEEPE